MWHTPLTMCAATLIESNSKGSAGILLAGVAFCKIGVIGGYRQSPPPINPLPFSYGCPPTSLAATHHACNGRHSFVQNGWWFENQMWLSMVDFQVVGWMVGPPPKTKLVCLFLASVQLPLDIFRLITLLASNRGHCWTWIHQRHENLRYFF